MRRTPWIVVAVLFSTLVPAAQAGEKGPNAVNVKLAIAAAGGSAEGLSDAELDSLLAEASARAGYGGSIPEGFDDAMARVYDIAVEILQESAAANAAAEVKEAIGEAKDAVAEGVAEAKAALANESPEVRSEAETAKFYGHIKGGNGEIVLNYATFELRRASDGKPYFVVKGRNGEVLGTSETYERNVASDSGGRYYPVNRAADPGDAGDGRWKAPALDSKGGTDRVYYTRDGEFHFDENGILRIADTTGNTRRGTKLDKAKAELIRSVTGVDGDVTAEGGPDYAFGNTDPSHSYGLWERDLFDLGMLSSEERGRQPDFIWVPGSARYSVKLHMIVGNHRRGILDVPGAEGRTFGDEVWNQPLRGIGVAVDGSVADIVILVVPADKAAVGAVGSIPFVGGVLAAATTGVFGWGPEGGFLAVEVDGGVWRLDPVDFTTGDAKATPWKHHDIQGLDAPTLEFTSGDGGPAAAAENHNSSRSNKSYPLAFVLGGGDGDSGPAGSVENHNSSRSNKSYPLVFVVGGGDGGTGFGQGTIPLIGSISVGVTFVPSAAPGGSGNIVVEYFGQMSNPFPFTKN